MAIQIIRDTLGGGGGGVCHQMSHEDERGFSDITYFKRQKSNFRTNIDLNLTSISFSWLFSLEQVFLAIHTFLKNSDRQIPKLPFTAIIFPLKSMVFLVRE